MKVLEGRDGLEICWGDLVKVISICIYIIYFYKPLFWDMKYILKNVGRIRRDYRIYYLQI